MKRILFITLLFLFGCYNNERTINTYTSPNTSTTNPNPKTINYNVPLETLSIDKKKDVYREFIKLQDEGYSNKEIYILIKSKFSTKSHTQ